MANRILLVAASIIFGTVLGFVIRPILDPPSAANQIDAVQPQAGPSKQTRTPRRAVLPDHVAAEEMPKPTADQSLVDLIDSVDVGERPSGDGFIKGRIRTDAGEPLSGVLISADANPKQMPGRRNLVAAMGGDHLRDKLMTTISFHKWSQMTRASTTSDEAGFYKLSKLPNLEFGLRAVLDGYQISPAKRSPRYLQPDATVDFVATWRPSVVFNIRDADGRIPERAVVNLKRNPTDGDWEHRWSKERNTVAMLGGRWFVDAYLDGDKSQRSEVVKVDVEEGQPLEPISLHFRQQAGVRGRVIVPEGVRAFPVVFLMKDIVAEDVNRDVIRRARRDRKNYTRLDGRDSYQFAFVGVSPGQYLLGVSLDRSTLANSAQVVVNASMVRQDLKLTANDSTDAIVVRVIGPNGKTVSDAHVRVSFNSSSYSGPAGGTALKRDDGAFLVRCEKPEQVSERDKGSYSLQASSSRYGRKSQPIDAKSHDDVTVQLDEPSFINLKLAGIDSATIRGKLKVGVWKKMGTGGLSGLGNSERNSEGNYVIGPLQDEADILLVVTLGAFKRLLVMPLHPKPGEQNMTVNLPKLTRLDIEVSQPKVISRVTLMSKEKGIMRWLDTLSTQGESMHSFENVPYGSYSLSYTVDGKLKEMEVMLPNASTITID